MGKASRGKWQRRLARMQELLTKAEEDNNPGKKLAIAGTLAMGLLTYVLPQTNTFILPSLGIMAVCLLYLGWHCWGLKETLPLRVVFITASAVAVTLIGNARYPRISVSPNTIKFRGSPEKFSLTVKNGTDSDKYGVRVPIQVVLGSQDKVSATYASPHPEVYMFKNEYQYCLGKDGNAYLVVLFSHLESGESQRFTIEYDGGTPFKASVRQITSNNEAQGFGPVGQLVIPNEYKVCGIHVAPGGATQ